MESLFRCPLCAAPLEREEHRYICPAGHSFDRAAAGYVHLLPANRKHSPNPGDDREMVAARSAFLDKGYYRPLADVLCQAVLPLLPRVGGTLLDARCGEGYYSRSLARTRKSFISLELSEEHAEHCRGATRSFSPGNLLRQGYVHRRIHREETEDRSRSHPHRVPHGQYAPLSFLLQWFQCRPRPRIPVCIQTEQSVDHQEHQQALRAASHCCAHHRHLRPHTEPRTPLERRRAHPLPNPSHLQEQLCRRSLYARHRL